MRGVATCLAVSTAISVCESDGKDKSAAARKSCGQFARDWAIGALLISPLLYDLSPLGAAAGGAGGGSGSGGASTSTRGSRGGTALGGAEGLESQQRLHHAHLEQYERLHTRNREGCCNDDHEITTVFKTRV